MGFKDQICFFGRVENILGKGENAGYHDVFKRPLSEERKNQKLFGLEFIN